MRQWNSGVARIIDGCSLFAVSWFCLSTLSWWDNILNISCRQVFLVATWLVLPRLTACVVLPKMRWICKPKISGDRLLLNRRSTDESLASWILSLKRLPAKRWLEIWPHSDFAKIYCWLNEKPSQQCWIWFTYELFVVESSLYVWSNIFICTVVLVSSWLWMSNKQSGI